jgi:hypothetical protein
MTVEYSVTAEFDSLEVASEYVSWLQHSHLADVLNGGATEARLVRLEPTTERPLAFQTRYRFPSMAAFTLYEQQFAPKLRAEGLAKFPASRGVRISRGLAEILSSLTR